MRANYFDVRLAAARTFQLDQDLAGFELVDEIREPPVTSGASDLGLGDCRHGSASPAPSWGAAGQ
jgi:hypothetical protein